jgi:hypothetical protein
MFPQMHLNYERQKRSFKTMKKTVCLLLLASTTLLGACGTKESSIETNPTSTSSSKSVSTSVSTSTSTSTSTSISTSEDTTTYAVRFYGDNDALLFETTVRKGATAVYKGNTPKKAKDNRNKYTFTGWDKELTNIQADTDFHAVFSSTVYAYQVTWQNPDGEVLYQNYEEIGNTPVYYPDEFITPYMNASATKYYTFQAWDKTATAITDADQTYTATYSESDYSLNYSFSTDHYILTGVSTTKATGYFVPDTYNDGVNGEYPVTTIAQGAFSQITNDKTLLKLGKNVATIQSRAFDAAWFSKITVEDGSVLHTSADRHVLYKDNEVLFFATHGIPTLCNTYTIADGATSIGDSAFYWNHYLTTLNLPDTVTEIKEYAFASSYIVNFHLGEGLQTIGAKAFLSDTALKTLTLPKSLVSIADQAFDNASKLATLNYEGTTADWAKVTLGTNWHRNAAFTAITCSDGSVTL